MGASNSTKLSMSSMVSVFLTDLVLTKPDMINDEVIDDGRI